MLENTKAVLAKAAFSDKKALKARINSQVEQLDVISQALQDFLEETNQRFQK